ncbi:dihydrodipicolinate reductase [Streptomyces sp. L7]
MCTLLSSGVNVVSTRGEFHHAPSLDPVVRKRVEDACAEGGTSVHSTGSSPGFITEALPIVLTSIQRRLDALTIDEFADLSQRDSPGLLFEVMGFGRPPAAFGEQRLTGLRDSFGPSLRLLAEALGTPLDSVEATGEVALARRSTTIAAGTLAEGTVAAQRITVFRSARRPSPAAVPRQLVLHHGPRPRLGPAHHRLACVGRGRRAARHRPAFPRAPRPDGRDVPSYTANRAVNAVPFVCAAAPGIRTTADLPQIVADLG